MVLPAWIVPASGPESNSAVILSVPGVCDWGTRTEAGQKVPQANPECAVASDLARCRRGGRPGRRGSPAAAGEVGVPR